MIRIGLMGCGVVATYGHIPAIQRTPGLELKSVFEPDTARMLDVKSRFHVPNGFTDVHEFFASGLDAIIVTSPAPTHLENVLLAAKAGKPVLCEKPLAMDESESIQMIETMAAAKLPLYVGFTYRFAPPAMQIKHLCDEGAIGKIRSLRMIYNWDCHGKFLDRNEAHGQDPRRIGRMHEGGPMVDCGVHQIDLARWWTASEIIDYRGHGAWVEEFEAPDHTYLHATHQSGAHTMVEISYSYAHTAREPRCHFVYEVIGSEGLIKYDRQARIFEMVNKHGTRHMEWTEEKNFDGMYHEFKQALLSNTPGHMPTASDGLAATRIARLATEQSIRERHPATR